MPASQSRHRRPRHSTPQPDCRAATISHCHRAPQRQSSLRNAINPCILIDARFHTDRRATLWTVSVSTWKADLYRRLWLGRGDGEEWPPGWVQLPRAIEVEWVKQLVAEQLRTSKDKRGFARQEWAKLRDRNEALDCAVLARAALWLLGADRYGERFWARLRDEVANAPLLASEIPTGGNVAQPSPPQQPVPPPETEAFRPRGWLGSRGGWLR